MIIFDNFSRRGNSLPVEEIGCLESIRDLLKQFEIISALAAVVSAVISLLEPPGAVVKGTAVYFVLSFFYKTYIAYCILSIY